MRVWLRLAVHTLSWLPLLVCLGVVFFYPPVNPVEYTLRQLGWWALVFVCASLAVTPLRRLTGWASLMLARRPLGLYAFFYASLHLLVFWGADLLFSLAALGREILKRPYITAGMLAYVLLIPLVLTSTSGMIKRLGAQRWKQLHRLVYILAPLAVVHFYWMKSSKADVREPLLFAGVAAILLGIRLAYRLVAQNRQSPGRAEY